MSYNQKQRYDNHFGWRELDDFNKNGEGVKDFSGGTPESAYKGMDRSEYESKIAARNAPTESSPVAAAPENTAAAQASAMKAGGQQVASAASDGNAVGTLGGGMSTAGMMMALGSKPSPASPYLMGAGLGLQVLGAAEQHHRDQQAAQRKAYNDRIANRQQIMQQIASQGIA